MWVGAIGTDKAGDKNEEGEGGGPLRIRTGVLFSGSWPALRMCDQG